jgi:sugar phosphate isomerase/epimerase
MIDSVNTVQRILEGTGESFGACVDTGHYFRSDESMSDIIGALGKQVHTIHIGDIGTDGKEVMPGDGRLDIPELLELLDTETYFDQPLVIAYEADPDDPTPAVEETAARIRAAGE